MWNFIFRNQKNKRSTPSVPFELDYTQTGENSEISPDILGNITHLENIFQDCSDIVFRKLTLGKQQIPAFIIFIQGMADEVIINESIMKSLMELQDTQIETPITEMIQKSFLQIGHTQEISLTSDIVEAALNGETILLVNGANRGIRIATQGMPSRNVSEPTTEAVVRGPKVGFTEDINVNTSLLRKLMKTPQLKMESLALGRVTKTKVMISYLNGTVDDKLVEEVRRRLQKIDVDSILESGYIEELIEDNPLSVFPQLQSTERPDKIAAAILEGRVAILVDGSPFVLVAPSTFVQFLHASEDYYERYIFSTAVRWIRYLFFLIALFLPGIYVAVTTYHHEMIPTPLLIGIAGAHEGVPFPSIVEALIMEITFEALREAGVRLPRPVGQAVSIVGALVIGQAAVEAGIVSPGMVIVVALTGIASFTIPSHSLAFSIRVLRFGMLVLAGFMGLYGILLGLLALLIHVTSLRSFGIPYLTSLAPFKIQDIKDVLWRAPWWAMEERPSLIGMNNRSRQKFFQKPRPPKSDQ
ncbi:spore germination protein [Ammoniphilus sp. 3BR4]|uniref:spore germination protein n=1 Tax=Ammoniphilus sp. 3BR4 TaxID=3158265 RepID=UPI0034666425